MIAISSACSLEYLECFVGAVAEHPETSPHNQAAQPPTPSPASTDAGTEISEPSDGLSGEPSGKPVTDTAHDILCGQKWFIAPEDCIEHMHAMPAASVDCAIFSPPFPSLFAYTSEACDIGNSEDLSGEAKIHLGYFFRGLRRVLKPGRVAVCHVMQIPRLARTGGRGLFDFRGLCIRLGQRAGLIFEYDWLITKNPQALRNGTGILTPRGFVPIESLVIGSEVIGSDGRPTKVAGVHPQGVRPLYRVTTSDGGFVDCDGRHLWTVKTTAAAKRDGESVTLTTEEMLRRGLRMPSGAHRFFLPVLPSAVEFVTADALPIDPYTLGVVLGDGMLSSRGMVGVCTSRENVRRFKLPAGHRMRELPESSQGNDVCSQLFLGDRWHNNEVLNGLRGLGLHGLRAWEKFIPRSYMQASVEDRRALLAGLLDTDGTPKARGGIRYSTTSARLARDFCWLVQSLGGVCTIHKEAGGAYFHNGEMRHGRDIYSCTPILRDGVCPFWNENKAARWVPPSKGFHRRIESIEPVGNGECTCITVEAKDGLFVTEHAIITHNSQAIRTHSHSLQFAGLERDRANSRGALGDYLIKFMAPGDNRVPITSSGQVSRNDWIEWAEAAWTNIKETDTLNTRAAKGENDTKHICPLQLGVIRRLVKLYSNPGEIVFSPFAGIGSEGHEAIRHGRRFYGCEIKPEYQAAAEANLKKAWRLWAGDGRGLFDGMEDENSEEGKDENRDVASDERIDEGAIGCCDAGDLP